MAVAAMQRSAERISGGGKVHRLLARQQPEAGERALGAKQIVGAETAGVAGRTTPADSSIAMRRAPRCVDRAAQLSQQHIRRPIAESRALRPERAKAHLRADHVARRGEFAPESIELRRRVVLAAELQEGSHADCPQAIENGPVLRRRWIFGQYGVEHFEECQRLVVV